MNRIEAEILKYKKTMMSKLILIIPVFFAVFSMAVQIIISENPGIKLDMASKESWKMFLTLSFNFWSFIFIPMISALLAGLVANQEKKVGNYRALCCHEIRPSKIWFYKIMGMVVYMLISTIVFIVVEVVAGSISAVGNISFIKILVAAIACFLVSISILPIQLFFATNFGMIINLAVGFVGMLSGVLMAPEKYWILNPYSWATRLMCPLIGVHPNGIVLNQGDPLLNGDVIGIGIIISMISFSILLFITGKLFEKKEFR